MISIELLTKHMAWANQEIYKEIKKLDPKVLDYYVIDKEWTVRTIMVHIVTASYLYSQRLQEKPFSKIEFDIESPDLIDDLIDALEDIDKDLIELKKITSNVSWKDFDAYENLKNRLKEERRLLKILEKQAAEKLSEEITNALPYIKDGSLISIKAPQIKRKIVPALICKKIYESQKIKSLLCLTIDNLFILIKPSYIVSIFNDLDAIDVLGLEVPKMYFSGEVFRGDNMSQCYADRILADSKKNDLQTPQYDLTTEVLAQQQQINNLEETVTDHPAHRFGDSKKLKKYRKRIVDVEQEINMRKKLLDDKENHNWRTFTDLIKILNHFGCLNDLELTEVGQTVSAIRSENELWIGLVLVSGYLDDLDPPELAAIIQAICVDIRRPKLWCNFKPSLKVIDLSFILELLMLQALVNYQMELRW